MLKFDWELEKHHSLWVPASESKRAQRITNAVDGAYSGGGYRRLRPAGPVKGDGVGCHRKGSC